MKKKVFIDGIETNYSVSDDGIIVNEKTGKVMIINQGYVQLILGTKHTRTSVGKLVLEAFSPNKSGKKMLVNHKDGDKMNNHLENLEWMTNKQNVCNMWEKRRENGTTGAGQKLGPREKKQENIVEIDSSFLTENEKQIEIDGELIPYSISKDGKVRNLP